MTDIIGAERFFGRVDANTPLFNREPGWLKSLQNMHVKPGGWIEARGGYQELKPSGGTTAEIATAPGHVIGYYDHTQSYGSVVGTVNDGTFTVRDIAPLAWYRLFGPASIVVAEPAPVLGTNVNTATWWAFGSKAKFSRLTFNIGQGCGGGSTYAVTWEYSKANGTWASLTGPTEDFKTSGVKNVVWTSQPSDWAPLSVGREYLYWVRVRITTIGVATQDCWGNVDPIQSDWDGRGVQLAQISRNTYSPTFWYGQTTAGVAVWTSVIHTDGVTFSTSGLVTSRAVRARLTSYQGRPYYVNGTNQGHTDFFNEYPLGIPAPGLSAFNVVAVAGSMGQASAFQYAITLSGGPNGSWGESSPTYLDMGAAVAVTAVQGASLTWTFTTTPVTGQADVVNVYRTNDLTNVPISAQRDQPFFRIARLTRSTVGVMPVAYTDNTYAFPFPSVTMDPRDNLPPDRCRFIHSFRGRVLLAGPEKHPNRGYWSKAGEGNAFDQEEDFAELVHPIRGSAVSSDTWYLWSEREQIGISDLDEDIANIYEVPGGVGCVAPDSAVSGPGFIMWLGPDGVYFMADGEVPSRVTDDQSVIFSKMSFATHGGSRAVIHDLGYEVHLMTPEGQPVGSEPHWRVEMRTSPPSWSTVLLTTAFSPFAVVEAPLGHADAGVLHPMYLNANPDVSNRTPYVGEYTTADNGTGFVCLADIHFGPKGFRKFSPRRFAAYYAADAGWGTPSVSAPPGATYIFKTLSGFGTVTPKAGTDYKLAVANTTEKMSGAQDVVVRFTVTSVDGGTARNQRLIAGYLDGDMLEIHPTG